MLKRMVCCLFITSFCSSVCFALNTGDLVAYPVPFNPKTQVLKIEDKNEIGLKTLNGVTVDRVKLEIFDINGDQVLKKTLSALPAKWNGRNSNGIRVKPGLYIIKIVVEETTEAKYGKKIIRVLVNY